MKLATKPGEIQHEGSASPRKTHQAKDVAFNRPVPEAQLLLQATRHKGLFNAAFAMIRFVFSLSIGQVHPQISSTFAH